MAHAFLSPTKAQNCAKCACLTLWYIWMISVGNGTEIDRLTINQSTYYDGCHCWIWYMFDEVSRHMQTWAPQKPKIVPNAPASLADIYWCPLWSTALKRIDSISSKPHFMMASLAGIWHIFALVSRHMHFWAPWEPKIVPNTPNSAIGIHCSCEWWFVGTRSAPLQ
jgi:hypothetical protein